jgi:Ras family protein T1
MCVRSALAAAVLLCGRARAPEQRAARWCAARRSTISALLFGPRGAGKGGLVKALAGRRHDEPAGAAPLVAAGPVAHSSGTKTLILTEVPADAAAAELLQPAEAAAAGEAAAVPAAAAPAGDAAPGSPGGAAAAAPGVLEQLARCDVALFAFDSSSAESFSAALELLLAASTAAGASLPCLLVAAKDDLAMSNELQQRCGSAATELEISAPVSVSALQGTAGSALSRAVDAALSPKGHVPDTPARKARRSSLKRLAIYSGIGMTGVAAGYLSWRLYRHLSSSSSSGSSGGSSSGGSSGGRPALVPLQYAGAAAAASSAAGAGDGAGWASMLSAISK